MKHLFLALALFSSVTTLCAQNAVERSPITMEQLMSELRIQGGNFAFTFAEPTYARLTTEVGEKGGAMQVERFTTTQSQQKIDLHFRASEMFVGDYAKPGVENTRKMMFKLSGCPETNGTRVIHYADKFVRSGSHAQYAPDIPAAPEYGKEYILHWYFKDGEAYQARATIEFSKTPFVK